MRIPAWPVAPATKTVEGSLRLVLPKDKPGEVGLPVTGIRDLTSGMLPKLKFKRKGLELLLVELLVLLLLLSEEEESALGWARRVGGKEGDFVALTLSLLGFVEVVVVRSEELEVRVGAMEVD